MRSQINRGLLVAWALLMVLQCVGCGAYWMPILYDHPRLVVSPDDGIRDAEHWTGDAACVDVTGKPGYSDPYPALMQTGGE